MAEFQRCLVCLQGAHTCARKEDDECLCVPLLQFCNVCEDHTDKRVCASCAQQMLARHTASHLPQLQNEAQRRAADEQWNMYANTLDEYGQNVGVIHQTMLIALGHMLEATFLTAMERIVLKATLFKCICPQGRFCLVAKSSDTASASTGLLVRTLVAQKLYQWFGCKTNVTLVNAAHNWEAKPHNSAFEVERDVGVEKIGLFTRLNLFDSCWSIALSALQYEHFYNRLFSQLADQDRDQYNNTVNEARDHVDDEIHRHIQELEQNRQHQQQQHQQPQDEYPSEAMFDLFYDEMEHQQRQQQRQQQQSVNAETGVKKSTMLCPLCRSGCTILSYRQSATERMAIEKQQQQEQQETEIHQNGANQNTSKTGSESKQLLSQRWDLRRCQRELLLMFDTVKVKEQCDCCKNYRDAVVEGGMKGMRSEFKAHAWALIVLLSILLCFDLALWQSLACIMLAPAILAVFGYAKSIRQLNCKADSKRHLRFFDAQIALHCLFRSQSILSDTIWLATAPGCVQPNKSNGAVHTTLSALMLQSEAADDDSDGRRFDRTEMPIDMLVEIQPKTHLGSAIDNVVKILYAPDASAGPVPNWFSIIVQSLTHVLPCVVLFLLLAYRAANCQRLFNMFEPLLVQLSTMFDRCRFRLNLRGATFAKRTIDLTRRRVQQRHTHNHWHKNRKASNDDDSDTCSADDSLDVAGGDEDDNDDDDDEKQYENDDDQFVWQFCDADAKRRFETVFDAHNITETATTPSRNKNSVLFERLTGQQQQQLLTKNQDILQERLLEEQEKESKTTNWVTFMLHEAWSYALTLYRGGNRMPTVAFWLATMLLTLHSATNDRKQLHHLLSSLSETRAGALYRNALLIKFLACFSMAYIAAAIANSDNANSGQRAYNNVVGLELFFDTLNNFCRLEATLLVCKLFLAAQWDAVWWCSNITNSLQAYTLSRDYAQRRVCAKVIRSSENDALGSAPQNLDNSVTEIAALACH